MATEAKNAEVVVAVNGDELGGRAPETSAAATGVEECTKDVGKVVEEATKFKLNPSAKEFVPSSRLNSSELNGDVVAASGSAMSADVLERRLDAGQLRRMRNLANGGWRRRIDRFRQVQEDCISRTVYITDIDRNVTEEYLAGVFSSYGTVLDCRICGDPNSLLRFGFIEFANENDARAALDLGGAILGLFRILVFPSKTAILPINPVFLPRSEDDLERSSRTIYCADIDKRVTRNQIKYFFESLCGQVSCLRLIQHHSHSTNIAFVEFDQVEGALAALNCSGMLLGEFNIRVDPSKTPVRSLILHR